jgi:hypothetical protein
MVEVEEGPAYDRLILVAALLGDTVLGLEARLLMQH